MNIITYICNISTFFYVSVILTLLSCNHSTKLSVYNDMVSCNDSTALYRENNNTSYCIGNFINPSPLSSQFFEDNNRTEYIIMDDNKLFCCNQDSVMRVLDISKCGTLNNYSGFLYLKDTIFVYNYKNKELFLLDSLCNIKKSWKFNKFSANEQYTIDPEAIISSPIKFDYPYIYLSGSRLGQIPLNKRKEIFLSCRIDIESDEIVYGSMYPEQYSEADFGGVYFNQVYHTYAEISNNLVLSFPADHCIYLYDKNLKKFQKHNMGSRYSTNINSSNYNSLELFIDKELRIKYYISQDSYGNILYDKYRDVFYRIARHPLSNWDGGNFVKPFSIIVMNREGIIKSETPILKDYTKLNLNNIHVTKKGLMIQKMASDENIIEFVTYKYTDK